MNHLFFITISISNKYPHIHYNAKEIIKKSFTGTVLVRFATFDAVFKREDNQYSNKRPGTLMKKRIKVIYCLFYHHCLYIQFSIVINILIRSIDLDHRDYFEKSVS